MNVSVYSVSDDKRTINKNIGVPITTYQGVRLKEDTDIINPIFRLTKIAIADLKKINYLYCEYLGRYYFINDITFSKGGIVELSCHVDVLQTYASAILSREAYVTRQENASKSQNYFYDSNYPIRSDVTVYPLPIGTVGSGVGYYLTVNGGVQTQ